MIESRRDAPRSAALRIQGTGEPGQVQVTLNDTPLENLLGVGGVAVRINPDFPEYGFEVTLTFCPGAVGLDINLEVLERLLAEKKAAA